MSQKTNIFIKNGYFCLLEKNENEPLEKLNQRGWFIATQQPKTDEEYQELIKLSNIWMNNKYYKCEYDITLMNKVKSLEEKLYYNPKDIAGLINQY